MSQSLTFCKNDVDLKVKVVLALIFDKLLKLE